MTEPTRLDHLSAATLTPEQKERALKEWVEFKANESAFDDARGRMFFVGAALTVGIAVAQYAATMVSGLAAVLLGGLVVGLGALGTWLFPSKVWRK